MFWRAAWKNDTHSQIMLGECFWRGHGVRRDRRQAVKWFRRVAERGSPPAQLRLAEMYETGRGMPRDIKEAAFWALLASAQEAPGARERWLRLNEALSPEDAEHVRRRALLRWPVLSWKMPLAALGRLLAVANEALPAGCPKLEESSMVNYWSPPASGDGEVRGLPWRSTGSD
jgi:TPR repeat protein